MSQTPIDKGFGHIESFAERLSSAFVSVSVSIVAVVSAIPELVGIYHVSNDLPLAVGIALTSVVVAHVAVSRRDGIGYGVFMVQLAVALAVIASLAGMSAELLYPLVTITGAAVMALSMEHDQAKADAAEAEDREFEREEKRKDAAHRRKLETIREKSQLSQGVTQSVPKESSQSSEAVTVEQIVEHIADTGDTGVSGMASKFGVSRQTIYRRLDDAEGSGLIHRNGKGIEVI